MPTPEAVGPAPATNALLQALPTREYEALLESLVPISLNPHDTLFDHRGSLDHVYFPTSGAVSLLRPTGNGDSLGIEVGLVGREGMLGLSVLLASEPGDFRYAIQTPTEALRLDVPRFLELVTPGCALYPLLLRYTYSFLTQIAQTLTCNSLHPVDQRLSKRLLLLLARTNHTRFHATHELLSALLGVRRATVTEAAHKLKQRGAIDYSRGTLEVLDRDALVRNTCSCYQRHLKALDATLRGQDRA